MFPSYMYENPLRTLINDFVCGNMDISAFIALYNQDDALQCFDNRKASWEWSYVVVLCVLAFLCAAGFILGTGEYWYYIIWACEVAAFCFASYLLLRKPTGKKK